MKTMEDAQLRHNQSTWVCWICKKQMSDMKLHTCLHIPRYLSGYETPIDVMILTTVCNRCLKSSSNYDLN